MTKGPLEQNSSVMRPIKLIWQLKLTLLLEIFALIGSLSIAQSTSANELGIATRKTQELHGSSVNKVAVGKQEFQDNGELTHELRPRQLQLTVGKSAVIDLASSGDLQVSRRGIIDALFLKDHQWQFTGLRSGLVVVRVEESGKTIEHLTIEVTKAIKDSAKTSRNWPAWICTAEGVVCHEDSRTIGGLLDDIEVFKKATEVCRRSLCLLKVALTKRAGLKYMAELQPYVGMGDQLRLNPRNIPIVTRVCRGSTPLPRLALALRKLTVICAEDSRAEDSLAKYGHAAFSFAAGRSSSGQLVSELSDSTSNRRQYVLEVFTRFKEDSNGVRTGFGEELFRNRTQINGFVQTSANLPVLKPTTNHQESFTARPWVLTREHEWTTLKKGGEVSYQTDLSSTGHYGRTVWREFGFQLRVKIDGHNSDRSDPSKNLEKTPSLTVTYEFELSLPKNGSRSSLSRDQIIGSATLVAGQISPVGRIEMQRLGLRSSFGALLSQLPIVGPLLGKRHQDTSHGHLELAFKVTEHHPGSPTP